MYNILLKIIAVTGVGVVVIVALYLIILLGWLIYRIIMKGDD